ncbi:phospholipase D family protein [Variovorax sp. dw_954]|uniref:phospholipase D family protein n=1 Tax=Variovorax sp. dw_954 TaxID=2720078 RepID=UPI0031F67587
MVHTLLRTLLCCASAVGLMACGVLPAARDRPAGVSAAADPSTALAAVVAASTPPGEHSGFRLLPLGVFSLDARLQLARRAERSLVVQYYQLENDATGRLLVGALMEAAARGVKVRILVDDLYTAKSEQLLLAVSRLPNIEVRLFNPFCCGRSGFVSRFIASPADIVRLNRRMHNKLFIADGVMAVVGGRNIADDYFALGEMQNFIDLDSLVVGKAIAQLEAIFDTYWNARQVWPIKDIVQGDEASMRMAMEMAAKAPKIELPSVDFLGYGTVAEELDSGRMGLLWGEARVVADPPTKPAAMTEAEAYEGSVTMKVWSMLMRAEVDVQMTSPYLVPGVRGMAAFADLGRRKVKLTLLTNSLAANDEPLVHTGYVRYRVMLLEGGADLYEVSPRRATSHERLGMFGKSIGRLHAKTVVVDSRHLFIGSMNLDPRSATQNTEMGIAIDSPELARELMRIIRIGKLQSAYRLRLSKDDGTLEWLTNDGDKEVVLTHEPESTWLLRFYNSLIAPIVPEALL